MVRLDIDNPRVFNFFHETFEEQLERNQKNADDDGDKIYRVWHPVRLELDVFTETLLDIFF